MKKFVLFALILPLFVNCTRETPDESVLNELPQFEYLGYTYYVHPHLAVYSDEFDYNEVNSSVKSLDSYGFRTWFIPSLNELEKAAKSGILPRVKYLNYISSTSYSAYHKKKATTLYIR